MGWLIVPGTLVGLALLVAVLWKLHAIGRRLGVDGARQTFATERGRLQERFFEAAAATGKPRGLRWVACEWDDAVVFARDRKSAQILALVGVTIRFEAVPGSDMEGLPAVGNLRNASALFHFQEGRWHTQGRALFNLNPDEALAHFQGQFEKIDDAS